MKRISPYPKNYVDVNGGKLIHHYTKFPFQTWWEYHCLEAHHSSDAKLWYHSHQRCIVLHPLDKKVSNFEMYRARFADRFEADVCGDELMRSKKDFCRPNPPKPLDIK